MENKTQMSFQYSLKNPLITILFFLRFIILIIVFVVFIIFLNSHASNLEKGIFVAGPPTTLQNNLSKKLQFYQ